MIVTMELEQDAHQAKETAPLKLTEVVFKVKPEVYERKRLFRKPLYELTVAAEANNQIYEFKGNDLDNKLVSQLERNPSSFLIEGEQLFLCGADWPDSSIAEVIKENDVPLDALFITDGRKVLAIIYNDEIPDLIHWMKSLLK